MGWLDKAFGLTDEGGSEYAAQKRRERDAYEEQKRRERDESRRKERESENRSSHSESSDSGGWF